MQRSNCVAPLPVYAKGFRNMPLGRAVCMATRPPPPAHFDKRKERKRMLELLTISACSLSSAPPGSGAPRNGGARTSPFFLLLFSTPTRLPPPAFPRSQHPSRWFTFFKKSLSGFHTQTLSGRAGGRAKKGFAGVKRQRNVSDPSTGWGGGESSQN